MTINNKVKSDKTKIYQVYKIRKNKKEVKM